MARFHDTMIYNSKDIFKSHDTSKVDENLKNEHLENGI